MKYAFYELATVRRMITVKLFNKLSHAEEKWHKRAIFVNLDKTRIIFAKAHATKLECEPSPISDIEPQFEMEELLLNQQEYGLLGFFNS